ncbi:MAG: sugar ABC transporter permease [Actinomycetales bacterium]|nr:sugar ABC transporter permease [Actinomycetales bacterium]
MAAVDEGDPPRRGRRQRSRSDIVERRAAHLFLAPWFLGLALITIGPILASAYLSFTDYSLLEAPNWIGWENYDRLLDDPRFFQSLKVTFIYVGVSVPLQLAFALALALVLDRGIRGLAFYRSAYYLPSLLGSSVAIAILWRQIFGTEGLINRVLQALGWDSPPGWVSTPEYSLWTLILLHVWTFGSPMIIFLAGLRQIPRMYYEAAEVDGAGRLRRFFSITIPLLTPIIFFNFVYQVIHSFQSFTQAFIVSSGTGGPADSTLFYTLYLYRKGFGDFDMGYASALAWVLLTIVAGLTAVNFVAAKWWVFYED